MADDSEFLYVLAFQQDRIVGAMGCEYDEELGRGWLQGPHADEAEWEHLAPRLFSEVLDALPAKIVTLDAYLNTKNTRGRRFYGRMGFRETAGFAHEYLLRSGDSIPPLGKICPPMGKEHAQSFLDLYNDLFPRAYYSGRRVLEMIGASHQVFVAVEGPELRGFAVVAVDEAGETGEIQFVGVREDSRGRGLGRDLLLSSAHWLLQEAGVSVVSLNVRDELEGARRLYESVGFRLRFTGIGLRRNPPDEKGET
jgi:ribosomal protein S18 acetylase RimI-like enzyme